MIQLTADQWQTFIADRPEANFLQSMQWGRLHESLGMTVVRAGVYGKDGELAAVWQGIVKEAKRGRYLEIPGAPLLTSNDEAQWRHIAQQLKMVAHQHACVFVRVRPQLLDSPAQRTLLRSAGFRRAPFHLHAEHTSILELTQPEDAILAGMRRQTRYEVRRAKKQDIEVSVSSEPAAIKEFYQVQADTAQRQGFVPSSEQFLSTLIETFKGDAKVYKATKDGQLLNLALVIWSGGEADYFEAASTPESRRYAGAYGLQWQSICDAKAAGMVRYNFWGIAYNNDPHHRYANVTTFKRGFGGKDTTYVPAHDLVVNRSRYLKNWLVETTRRKKRKL